MHENIKSIHYYLYIFINLVKNLDRRSKFQNKTKLQKKNTLTHKVVAKQPSCLLQTHTFYILGVIKQFVLISL